MTVATDEHLVTQLVAGDPAALGAVYDRHADRIHDFCLRMLHDPSDAADATQDTFLVAARRAETLRDRSKLRPWLYAVARTQCLDRLRERRRTEPADDLEPAIDDDPGRDAERTELASLVHAAAGGLDDRDRAALELHLRHDLDGQALADALGVTPDHGRKIAQRVRNRLERALTALVVARHGSRDCSELAGILGNWGGELTPLLRKRVSRHVDGCATCDDHRRRALAPTALLAALPIAPPPHQLRAQLISAWQHGDPPARDNPRQWEPSGFPADDTGIWSTRRTMLTISLVLVAALLLGVVTGLATAGDNADAVDTSGSTVVTRADEPDDPLPTRPTDTPSTTTTTRAPVSTAAPTSTAMAATVVDPPPVTAPVDRTSPVVLVSADPGAIWEQTGYNCETQPTESTVVAEVSDDRGIAAVRFRWDGPAGSEERLAIRVPYVVTVGPFPAEDVQQSMVVTVEVTAHDDAGNIGMATVDITVTDGAGPCPPR